MQGSISDKTQINIESDTHGSHHEAHPDHRIFGLIVFLVAEGMIFLGLFIAYLAFRSMAPEWPPAGTPKLELMLPGINTVILLASSLVIHQADTAIKKNDVKGLQLWFGLTALMGIIFLGGQLYEYSHLEFGLRTNLFASTFYVLTGFHGLHVTVGVLLILSVLWRSRSVSEGESMKSEHYGTNNRFGVEAAEIYWHFVDVIWVILFILLYLL
ncbi:heme-copper oxidase subunit III [Chamaesiphon sp. GL140_3_metabinner_50]|uniref:cytochrome c oxidase subunit 3 n=1 Tax=Chamaesiphon sp. GL140_3_metabinner_50 TaxID=2970812 RepID=UPI0025F10A93|nr:heme-copper oxidase subunit III [Chamaesiphon sp. GL140_3_metabinner_50]